MPDLGNENEIEIDRPPFPFHAVDEETQEEEAEAPIVIHAPRKKSPVRKEIDEQGDKELQEYLNELSTGSGSMRIRVIRKHPKAWKGHNIEGALDTFEEPISEETIKELYGGGTYHLMIQTPNEQGKWKYAAHRTVKIAGDPVIRGLIEDEKPVPAAREDASVAKVAIESMTRMMNDRSRDRDRAPDPTITTLVEGLQAQLLAVQKALTEKDNRLLDFVNKKPENGITDRLFEKMVDGESSRIEALRIQHLSEVNTTRERLQADIDRIHSSYKDQVSVLLRSHEREIDSINRSNDARIEALKLAHGSTEQGYKRELTHLDRELTSVRSEVERLRSEKTKTPYEMMTEVSKMKEALEVFGGGGEEPAAGSTIERVINGLMSSPMAQGIAQRIAEGPGGPPGAAGGPAPTPADIEREFPVNQPRKMPDGKIVVRKADGTFSELKPKKKPKVEVKGGETIQLDPVELKAAVKFMESSVGKDPKIFAQSIRSMVPVSLQKAIGSSSGGVDHFLDEVANLEPGSPLLTQVGRDWVREVAKFIFHPG